MQGILKGGSITVPLTSCLTGLESAVWQMTIFVFICKTGYSKPVKQVVNGTVIFPPLVFPEQMFPNLRPIYTGIRFRIRVAHFIQYKK